MLPKDSNNSSCPPTYKKNFISNIPNSGIIVLCLWVVHFVFLLFYMVFPLPILVLINIGSLVIYLFAFLLIIKGHSALSLLLVSIEVSIYCLLNVYLIGWSAGTQWFIPSTMLLCQLTYSIGKKNLLALVSIMGLALGGCYILRCSTLPVYTDYNVDFIVLINIIIVVGGTLTAFHFTEIGSLVTELYYMQRIDNLSSDAYVDALTGLWNRRYGTKKLDELVSNPAVTTFSVAMIDVDFFKNVNDTHGHPFGDIVLKHLSDSIVKHFRSEDIAIRWGGEEFIVVFPNVSGQIMFPKMDLLRKDIEKDTIACKDISVKITITIGISEYRSGQDVDSVIEQSDIALYYGKNNGRNKVILYSDIPKQ